MSNKYDFASVEPKWQKYWEEHGSFRASEDHTKPKFYALVEFPYPSGHGMHVGHIKAYSGLEVVSRKRRMQGYNVLFPIGFDAYGLPTENTAIKTGVHPRKVTDDNIVKFTGQLKRVGFSFDWSRVIDTTDEKYYKWTQWIFLKMFEKGLAFRDKTQRDRPEDQGSLVSADHRVCRQAAAGSGRSGLSAECQAPAAELDRQVYRCICQLRCQGTRRRKAADLYHPSGYPVRCHLYGDCSGAPDHSEVPRQHC